MAYWTPIDKNSKLVISVCNISYLLKPTYYSSVIPKGLSNSKFVYNQALDWTKVQNKRRKWGNKIWHKHRKKTSDSEALLSAKLEIKLALKSTNSKAKIDF